jgi:hypothetical protein
VGIGEFSPSKNLAMILSNAGFSGIVAKISLKVAGLNCRSSIGGPVVYDPVNDVWRLNRSIGS